MVDGIVVNGSTKSVHAKITKANLKKVFLNNIKGKRGYIKGISTQVDKGENFYKKLAEHQQNLQIILLD